MFALFREPKAFVKSWTLGGQNFEWNTTSSSPPIKKLKLIYLLERVGKYTSIYQVVFLIKLVHPRLYERCISALLHEQGARSRTSKEIGGKGKEREVSNHVINIVITVRPVKTPTKLR